MSVNHRALVDVSHVFHFEFWLRYYFVEEKDGRLFITLNEEQRKQVHDQFSEYWELAERVEGVPLSFELSQRVVVEFLQLHMDGVKYPPAAINDVLDNKEFSVEMQLFDTWINLHEEQLMQKIYGFDTWMHIYGEWKDTDKTKQMAQALRLHMQDEHSSVN